MTREEALKNATLCIARALHDDRVNSIRVGGKTFEIKNWAGGNCRGIDLGEYRFVTQNPATGSKWAMVAQRGGQVTWVIHRFTNLWVANVFNSNYEQQKRLPCAQECDASNTC